MRCTTCHEERCTRIELNASLSNLGGTCTAYERQRLCGKSQKIRIRPYHVPTRRRIRPSIFSPTIVKLSNNYRRIVRKNNVDTVVEHTFCKKCIFSHSLSQNERYGCTGFFNPSHSIKFRLDQIIDTIFQAKSMSRNFKLQNTCI